MLIIRREQDANRTHSRTKRGTKLEPHQRLSQKYVDANTRQSTIKSDSREVSNSLPSRWNSRNKKKTRHNYFSRVVDRKHLTTSPFPFFIVSVIHFHSPCSPLTPPTPPLTTLKAKKRLFPPGNHQRVELFTLFLQQVNMAIKRPSVRPQLLKLHPHRPLLNQVLD